MIIRFKIIYDTRRLYSVINKSKRPKSLWSYRSITLLSIPVVTFGLGCWQIKRRKWKLNLIDQLETLSRQQPKLIDDFKDELNTIPEYSHVYTEGLFLPNVLFIGPRILKDSHSNNSSGLVTTSKKIGYHVIQPFLSSHEPNLKFLVNRGWIPDSMLQKYANQIINGATPNHAIKIHGLIRHPETRSKEITNQMLTQRIFLKRDEIMADILETYPLFIDMIDGSIDPNESSTTKSKALINDKNTLTLPPPITGQTNIQLRNEHLNYAITWFGLSMLSGFMWYSTFVP